MPFMNRLVPRPSSIFFDCRYQLWHDDLQSGQSWYSVFSMILRLANLYWLKRVNLASSFFSFFGRKVDDLLSADRKLIASCLCHVCVLAVVNTSLYAMVFSLVGVAVIFVVAAAVISMVVANVVSALCSSWCVRFPCRSIVGPVLVVAACLVPVLNGI